MAQMLLTISTSLPSIRGDAVGWSCDDSSLYRGVPIGMTPPPRFAYTYPNVLAAMYDGWKLLAPPLEPVDGDNTWQWWLVKESAK
jgi:hypothetical protein